MWSCASIRILGACAYVKHFNISGRATPLLIEQTGGGTNLSLQAGLYEAMKSAVPRFYGNKKLFPLGFEHQAKVDSQGSNIQETYRINSCYTINLYHITSRALVNGAQETQFVSKHLPSIIKSIDEAEKHTGMTAKQLNNYIKKTTKAYLDQSDTSNQQEKQTTTHIRCSSKDPDIRMLQSMSNQSCTEVVPSLSLDEDPGGEDITQIAQRRRTGREYGRAERRRFQLASRRWTDQVISLHAGLHLSTVSFVTFTLPAYGLSAVSIPQLRTLSISTFSPILPRQMWV